MVGAGASSRKEELRDIFVFLWAKTVFRPSRKKLLCLSGFGLGKFESRRAGCIRCPKNTMPFHPPESQSKPNTDAHHRDILSSYFCLVLVAIQEAAKLVALRHYLVAFRGSAFRQQQKHR